MKNAQIKRLLSLILVVAIITTFAVALTACDNAEDALQKKVQELQNKVTGYEDTFTEKAINIQIGNGEDAVVISTTTRESNLFTVMSALKEEKKIEFDANVGSTYGAFLNSIGSIVPDATANEYVGFYHDIDDAALKGYVYGTYDYKTLTVGEKTYFYSNVGVSLMPVVDGATYLFVIETY